MTPITPPHRSPKLYGIALRCCIYLRDGKAVQVIDALPLPLKPANAAAWFCGGLPLVIASSVEEAHQLCREAAVRHVESRQQLGGAQVEAATPNQHELFQPAPP